VCIIISIGSVKKIKWFHNKMYDKIYLMSNLIVKHMVSDKYIFLTLLLMNIVFVLCEWHVAWFSYFYATQQCDQHTCR